MGVLVWLGFVAALLVGPGRFWDRQVHRAEKSCHCACGAIFAERQDLPAVEPPASYRPESEWFGAHSIVCFPKGTTQVGVRVRELQRQADHTYLLRWRDENEIHFKKKGR